MKKILFILIVFIFSGCEDIILEDSNTTDTTKLDGLPKKYSPIGDPVSLEKYLYPSLLDIDKNVYMYLYTYLENIDGKIINKPIKEKSFTKTIGYTNTQIITEFIDNKKIKSDYITQDTIKISIDNKILYEYPKRVYTNSILTQTTENGVTKLCVVKYIGKKDLLPILPTFIQNNLDLYISTKQLNFNNILHVECGTTNYITTNIYYSDIYGEVLNIEKNTTNHTSIYKIIDPKSVETR